MGSIPLSHAGDADSPTNSPAASPTNSPAADTDLDAADHDELTNRLEARGFRITRDPEFTKDTPTKPCKPFQLDRASIAQLYACNHGITEYVLLSPTGENNKFVPAVIQSPYDDGNIKSGKGVRLCLQMLRHQYLLRNFPLYDPVAIRPIKAYFAYLACFTGYSGDCFMQTDLYSAMFSVKDGAVVDISYVLLFAPISPDPAHIHTLKVPVYDEVKTTCQTEFTRVCTYPPPAAPIIVHTKALVSSMKKQVEVVSGVIKPTGPRPI
jgi:hypothetical protein